MEHDKERWNRLIFAITDVAASAYKLIDLFARHSSLPMRSSRGDFA